MQPLHEYVKRSPWQIDLLGLALLSGVVLFLGLGQNYHWASREIRHAEIIREMVASGDYLLPRRMGKLYFDKPPVFHWIGAVLMKIRGEPTLFDARFPLALAGLCGVLATYVLGRVLLDRRTALVGALSLLAMPNYVIMGRQARPDMVLALAVLIASVCLVLGMQPPASRRRTLWFFCAGIASGVGVLTKGPYGVLFPLLFAATIMWQRREWKRPTPEWILFLSGMILLLAVWAVPTWLRDGGGYLESILTQHDLTTGAEGHRRNFFWYLGPLALTALPLTLFFPWVVKRWKENGFSPLLAAAAVMLLVLSCVPGKRNHYLLPLFPFIALGIADAIVAFSHRSNLVRRGALILIPLFMLGYVVYYNLALPWLNPGGDPEYRFALETLRRAQGEKIVCQGGIDEELAWVQRGFSNLYSEPDGPELATRLAALDGNAYMAADKKQARTVAKQLPSGAALVELFSVNGPGDKIWTLYLFERTANVSRPP